MCPSRPLFWLGTVKQTKFTSLRTVPPFVSVPTFCASWVWSGFLRTVHTNVKGLFVRFMTVGKADLSKGYYNAKRKFGVATDFSELMELKFGKKMPYTVLYFQAFLELWLLNYL